MSLIKELDALDMEFQYYSCLIKELILLLPSQCELFKAKAWVRKLSDPMYNVDPLRNKRNHYLLMLTISMSLNGLKHPFDIYPPLGALPELACIRPKKPDPAPVCPSAAPKPNEEPDTCDLHATECPEDTHNVGKVLDEQFKFLIQQAEPRVSCLSNPSDRERARQWICFLSAIKGKCFHLKGVRNEYAMLLSGYLMNDEMPGPFLNAPIDKIVPLEELVKITDMSNHMLIDPTHPKSLKFFRDVPHPEEGAFAFIAVSGDLCFKSAMETK